LFLNKTFVCFLFEKIIRGFAANFRESFLRRVLGNYFWKFLLFEK